MDISAAGKTMGKDEFLKLFTNQLKNQDPMKPMDSSAFTAQLAQFSSLEQLFNINNGLEQLTSVGLLHRPPPLPRLAGPAGTPPAVGR